MSIYEMRDARSNASNALRHIDDNMFFSDTMYLYQGYFIGATSKLSTTFGIARLTLVNYTDRSRQTTYPTRKLRLAMLKFMLTDIADAIVALTHNELDVLAAKQVKELIEMVN